MRKPHFKTGRKRILPPSAGAGTRPDVDGDLPDSVGTCESHPPRSCAGGEAETSNVASLDSSQHGNKVGGNWLGSTKYFRYGSCLERPQRRSFGASPLAGQNQQGTRGRQEEET